MIIIMIIIIITVIIIIIIIIIRFHYGLSLPRWLRKLSI